MTNYLVTGGAGFIGSHLTRALLALGGNVRVFDNFSTGKLENLKGLETSVEIQEGDLRNFTQVLQAAQNMDVIFHQAAFVSVPQSMLDPKTCFDVNVRGTENILEAARQSGVKRVVLASSSAVYGLSENQPLVENEPLSALSPYGASKQINEIQAQLYTRAFGLEVVALRYFNVFGPRQNPDSEYAAVVPIFMSRLKSEQPITIFGDGGQTRDMVFVADVAHANILATQSAEAPGQAWNVCTGREVSMLTLAEMIQELFPGSPEIQFAPPRSGDIYRSLGNPVGAEKALGFVAKNTLLEGLSQTADWMRGQ